MHQRMHLTGSSQCSRLTATLVGLLAYLGHFSVYAEETAGADHAANNNNTFTRCQNEVVSLPTSLSPSPTFKSTPLQSTTPLSEVSSPLVSRYTIIAL